MAGVSDVVVVGAGLTGLSAAVSLTERHVEHRVFEGSEHPGGLATTTEEAGYRFDRTGHLLHLRNAEMAKRVLGWLGPGTRSIERNSAIWTHGVYSPYPFQANTRALPPEVAYECVLGFLRATREVRKEPPRTFEEFCQHHFGPGFSRHFMLPYNSRLLGVHPRELSHEWCDRFVPIPSLEDVVAGTIGLPGRRLGYNATFHYPEGGIGALPAALHAKLPDIELGRALLTIDPVRRELRVTGETLRYERLISTIPLPTLLRRIAGLPSEVAHAAAKLRHTSLYYLDIALRAPCRQPYHWVYVPEERYPFYRVGCYSHFSPTMAPPGAASLYVELVDRSEPQLSKLLPQVAASLVEMGLIAATEDIAFARLRHIEHAYVVYDHAHAGATHTAHAYLRNAGILSVGRYGSWNYSSMEDALLYGEEAANLALALR